MLHGLGLRILATRGTAAFLTEHGVPSDVVNKAYEGGRTIVDVMKDGEVALVMNTTDAERRADGQDPILHDGGGGSRGGAGNGRAAGGGDRCEVVARGLRCLGRGGL